MKILKRGFSRKYEDLRLRIDCVDVLVAIKEAFRYIELSSMLDLPVSTLSKYYHGLTIPDKETSKRILSKLLSREIVKDFIHRLIRNKKYGSLVKLLSNPLITNYLSLYFYMKIIDRLAGTNVTALIAPPDTSVLLALGIAFRLDVPLALIQSTATPIYESLELVREVGIDKGSSTIAIYSILGRECIPYLKKFIELLKLDLKFIGTIILVDRPILNELPKKVTVEYLLP